MPLTLPTMVRGFHDYYKLTASPRDQRYTEKLLRVLIAILRGETL